MREDADVPLRQAALPAMEGTPGCRHQIRENCLLHCYLDEERDTSQVLQRVEDALSACNQVPQSKLAEQSYLQESSFRSTGEGQPTEKTLQTAGPSEDLRSQAESVYDLVIRDARTPNRQQLLDHCQKEKPDQAV